MARANPAHPHSLYPPYWYGMMPGLGLGGFDPRRFEEETARARLRHEEEVAREREREKERELREQREREREQREKEQREKEQREREQREKEQREKEQREREREMREKERDARERERILTTHHYSQQMYAHPSMRNMPQHLLGQLLPPQTQLGLGLRPPPQGALHSIASLSPYHPSAAAAAVAAAQRQSPHSAMNLNLGLGLAPPPGSLSLSHHMAGHPSVPTSLSLTHPASGLSHPSLGLGHPSVVPPTSLALSHPSLMSHAGLNLSSASSSAAAAAAALHLVQSQSLNLAAAAAAANGQPAPAHSHPANLSVSAAEHRDREERREREREREREHNAKQHQQHSAYNYNSNIMRSVGLSAPGPANQSPSGRSSSSGGPPVMGHPRLDGKTALSNVINLTNNSSSGGVGKGDREDPVGRGGPLVSSNGRVVDSGPVNCSTAAQDLSRDPRGHMGNELPPRDHGPVGPTPVIVAPTHSQGLELIKRAPQPPPPSPTDDGPPVQAKGNGDSGITNGTKASGSSVNNNDNKSAERKDVVSPAEQHLAAEKQVLAAPGDEKRRSSPPVNQSSNTNGNEGGNSERRDGPGVESGAAAAPGAAEPTKLAEPRQLSPERKSGKEELVADSGATEAGKPVQGKENAGGGESAEAVVNKLSKAVEEPSKKEGGGLAVARKAGEATSAVSAADSNGTTANSECSAEEATDNVAGHRGISIKADEPVGDKSPPRATSKVEDRIDIAASQPVTTTSASTATAR